MQFGEGSATFLPDWLRDNCQCAECRIVQTDERRWQPWTEQEAPVVGTVDVVDGHLQIGWVGGHTSTYGPDDWDKIRTTGARGAWKARLWSSGYEIERFDHHQSIDDQITRRAMLEALRRDGAVVITGSPTEPGTVIGLLRSLGITMRDSSLGLIFDVKLDPAGYNIAFTAEEVPPHNDNAQYSHPPSGQVLAMLVNDAQGGNSVVVDGWSVLDQLNSEHPEAIEVLSRVEVGFRQYSTEADAFTRAPLVVCDRAGRRRGGARVVLRHRGGAAGDPGFPGGAARRVGGRRPPPRGVRPRRRDAGGRRCLRGVRRRRRGAPRDHPRLIADMAVEAGLSIVAGTVLGFFTFGGGAAAGGAIAGWRIAIAAKKVLTASAPSTTSRASGPRRG